MSSEALESGLADAYFAFGNWPRHGHMDAWRNTIKEDPLRWWRGLRAVFEQGALPSLTVFLTRLVGIRVLLGDACNVPGYPD